MCGFISYAPNPKEKAHNRTGHVCSHTNPQLTRLEKSFFWRGSRNICTAVEVLALPPVWQSGVVCVQPSPAKTVGSAPHPTLSYNNLLTACGRSDRSLNKTGPACCVGGYISSTQHTPPQQRRAFVVFLSRSLTAVSATRARLAVDVVVGLFLVAATKQQYPRLDRQSASWQSASCTLVWLAAAVFHITSYLWWSRARRRRRPGPREKDGVYLFIFNLREHENRPRIEVLDCT